MKTFELIRLAEVECNIEADIEIVIEVFFKENTVKIEFQDESCAKKIYVLDE